MTKRAIGRDLGHLIENTRWLREIADISGIRGLDHIITGRGRLVWIRRPKW